MLETEFLRSYQLSGGDPLYLLERPGAMALIAVMIFSFAMTAWSKRRMARLEARELAAMEALHEESAATSALRGPR
jgi:putative tricarboxylic transport membrane protein